MTDPAFDFSVFESVLTEELTKAGLTPVPSEDEGDRSITALPGLQLHRDAASMAEVEGETLKSVGFELQAKVEVPGWDTYQVMDYFSDSGDSKEEALTVGARNFATVTVPALVALAKGDMTAATGIKLTSATQGMSSNIEWHVFGGNDHVVGQKADEAREFFRQKPLFIQVLDAVTGMLSAPQLHWCFINLSKTADGNLLPMVYLDNNLSAEGMAELQAKISELEIPDGPWEIRTFYALLPKQPKETFAHLPPPDPDNEAWRKGKRDGNIRNNSFSTSAPHVKLQTFHYLRSHDGMGCLFKFLALPFIVMFVLSLIGQMWLIAGIFLIPTAAILWMLNRILANTRMKYQDALLTPGIIVEESPLRFAVLAPLANSSDFSPTSGDAIKVISTTRLPGHPKTKGTRIPCVSSFTAGEDMFYWKDFDPEPIAWGTKDPAEIKRCEEKIGIDAFRELETYIAAGKIPTELNKLMRLDLEEENDANQTGPPPIPPPIPPA